jgi:hypothetical protein
MKTPNYTPNINVPTPVQTVRFADNKLSTGNNGYTTTSTPTLKDANASIGSIRSNAYATTKTSGVETRGNGAATKGRIARGPMA